MPKKSSSNANSGLKPIVRKLLLKVPAKPGVYLFRDEDGEVLYIGKAKNLEKRVKSYFQEGKDLSAKVQVMRKKVEEIETIVVNNEVEALVLESNLVREHQPRYNAKLRDDKNFLYVKITSKDDFPEVMFVRKMERDKQLYFGPYTSAESIRSTMELAQKLFPYRTCHGEISYLQEGKVKVRNLDRKYPCLEYDIKRCVGPCTGQVSKAVYRAVIEQLISFLKGDSKPVLDSLQSKMQKAASERNFELASKYRDQLQAVGKIADKQHVVSSKQLDQDVIAVAIGHKLAIVTLLQIRTGKLLARENFKFAVDERFSAEANVIASFLTDYYLQAASLPKEVILQEKPEDLEAIAVFLEEKLQHKFNFLSPERGEKVSLLNLAQDNAKQILESLQASWERDEERTRGANDKLAKVLGLKKLKRMECFDISHISGTETVASMAVFKNGKPVKADYRHFKVKTLQKGAVDDYAALQEVLERRLKYLKKRELPKGYTIRKLKKNELAALLEKLKDEKLSLQDFDYRACLVLEKKKKIIGCCRLRTYETGERELSTLWVEKSERGKGLGHILLLEIIKKLKPGKVYGIVVAPELASYYEEIGAQRIHVLPSFVEKKWEHVKAARRKWLMKNAIPMLYLDREQKTDKSFLEKPDLIVIDGGKGQLNSVKCVVDSMGIKNLNLISLAKREEEIFILGKKSPLILKKDSNELHLLQRLRDEAHRFAIEYHRKLREKGMTRSSLDEIVGIGEETKQKLLGHFGSVEKIKEASSEELASLIGSGKSELVLKYLTKD